MISKTKLYLSTVIPTNLAKEGKKQNFCSVNHPINGEYFKTKTYTIYNGTPCIGEHGIADTDSISHAYQNRAWVNSTLARVRCHDTSTIQQLSSLSLSLTPRDYLLWFWLLFLKKENDVSIFKIIFMHIKNLVKPKSLSLQLLLKNCESAVLSQLFQNQNKL